MRIIDLPPRTTGDGTKRPGYRSKLKSCEYCPCRFCVYIPLGVSGYEEYTMEVKCPACHRATAEVLVTNSAADILVEALK